MYEARQNKEKVSRRIESAGDRVTRRVKVDSGGRLINVIQRKLYDSKKYYRLFDDTLTNWRDGNRSEFYIPTRKREPHIHAYSNGVVYTAIGHNHSYLVDRYRNINVQSVGTAKDDIRNLIVNKYNPQNEMFRRFRTKCFISQNETYHRESFFSSHQPNKKALKELTSPVLFIAFLFGYLAKNH